MVGRCGQQKCMVCSTCELCYVIRSKQKQVFDGLAIFSAYLDIKRLRSDVFCANDR